jgi:mono/diheme cytochrome c family protein
MRTTLVTLMVALWVPVSARAEAPDVDYLRDVKPIFARRCTACHGGLKQKSGLRLDTAARALRGGDGGPVIEPGKSGESPLIDAITGAEGLRMPPEAEGEPLSTAEIGVLKAWVDAGAKAPAKEAEPPDPRAHWAFQAPRRSEVPTIGNATWVRNPIDAFLAAGYEKHGLQPSPAADKNVLIRRVYLDLVGLVPSPAEVKAFVEDAAGDAYEKMVERLLDSPRYGERWGRHWMDVWRYSDWDGFSQEVRESQPHIWHWRDWIVESLNADKGYDRMVVEMLAADEAAPGDESALRATGYLVRSWYKFSRNVWLDSIIEHSSKAFLGLTINCARCHDHKYDPIAQTDYYRFRAFFEPHEIRTDRLPGQPDTTKAGLPHVYDAKADANTYLFRRGDEKNPQKEKALTPGVPAVLRRKELVIEPVALPIETSNPGLRKFVQEETIAQARAEVVAKKGEQAKAVKGSPEAKLAELSLAVAQAGLTAAEARVAADIAKSSRPPRSDADLLARLAAISERHAATLKAEDALARAEAVLTSKREALKPKPDDSKAKQAVTVAETQLAAARKALDAARVNLSKADGAYTPLSPAYPPTSTGRRLALARWIASRENPLAARVAVNHVWMRHFGSPLVPTVADFGLNGKPTDHPELLDWLAVEFMERGWSFKALHRLIVTSNAYRMRSTGEGEGASASNLASDPGNRYLWRMNPRRMEAEAVRDNVLAIAGSLEPAMGGPDLDPALGETSGRRSLYFRHAKEKRMTFLKLFDSPSVTACYRRSESVVPQQALALANSKLSLQQAQRLAKTLGDDVGAGVEHDAAFIESAFDRILGRGPTPEERAECVRYLAGQPARPASRVRADLVHVLFNHNDFVTVR